MKRRREPRDDTYFTLETPMMERFLNGGSTVENDPMIGEKRPVHC